MLNSVNTMYTEGCIEKKEFWDISGWRWRIADCGGALHRFKHNTKCSLSRICYLTTWMPWKYMLCRYQPLDSRHGCWMVCMLEWNSHHTKCNLSTSKTNDNKRHTDPQLTPFIYLHIDSFIMQPMLVYHNILFK